jgi:cytidylate kinase
MANLIITIDGPAASGKSTVARLLAEKLRASFLDTGAMYRAVTLAAIENGVDMTNEQNLLDVVDNRKFEFVAKQGKMVAYIDGVDVTDRIRGLQVTTNARHIASSPKMREKMVQMQRQFAASQDKIVTEGRDQGTVVFPNADIKFYLTADITERAKRRQAQLRCQGTSENLHNIKKAIQERDKSDENRAVGPLKPASDAIVVDTTDLSIEQVVEKLLYYVEEKCPKKHCK